jgi:hypothetical protein
MPYNIPLIDGKLVIEVTIPPEEFIANCLEKITDGNTHIFYIIQNTITYYIISSLEKYPFLSNVKYRTSRLPYKLLNLRTLEEFINVGYFALQWYEFTFDCVVNSNIDDIDFVFSDVLTLENSFSNGKNRYIKKNILKTKETYKIHFWEIRIDKNILVKINQSITDESFSIFILEKNLKKYGYHTVKNDIIIADYSHNLLPFPIAVCPVSGAFVGFKTDTKSSDIYFCSCIKPAIANNVELHQLWDNNIILSKIDFPGEFINSIELYKITNNTCDILKCFDFRDNICHECNKKIPNIKPESIIECYIRKRFYEYGIDSLFGYVIASKLPENIRKIIWDAYPAYADRETDYLRFKNVSDQKIEKKLYRKIAREIKNDVLSVLCSKKPNEKRSPIPKTHHFREFVFTEAVAIRQDEKITWLDMEHLDIPEAGPLHDKDPI